MRTIIKTIYLLFFVFLLLPRDGICQKSESEDSSNINLLIAAREIMKESGTCALITLDDEGRPRARTMDPFLPEDDFTVWFGTNSNSRKVVQIKNDPRVTLYYYDSKKEGYVVINGTAQLVDESVEKEKYWKEEWAAFYPNKADNYLLIKVSPIWMEVLSPGDGIYNDTITWQPPIILFDSVH